MQVGTLALLSEDDEEFHRLVVGGTEPARYVGVEHRHLAGCQDKSTVAEQERQAAVEDVDPLIALVGLQSGLVGAGVPR